MGQRKPQSEQFFFIPTTSKFCQFTLNFGTNALIIQLCTLLYLLRAIGVDISMCYTLPLHGKAILPLPFYALGEEIGPK
ncbi:uncharacterized protein LOC128856319 isoform X2 [Anastrepha ludens]|uniref:uncharacterized protein LOC128856319 isoform X2 n=1 Tax=Anastrepha ludens TaxID=28586 RepID=UPI0023B12AF2|nr:uncharacterized protein LOC128856319 isoform X2 [Anastrepha ludens]